MVATCRHTLPAVNTLMRNWGFLRIRQLFLRNGGMGRRPQRLRRDRSCLGRRRKGSIGTAGRLCPVGAVCPSAWSRPLIELPQFLEGRRASFHCSCNSSSISAIRLSISSRRRRIFSPGVSFDVVEKTVMTGRWSEPSNDVPLTSGVLAS
jgi:hypothetical protein